MTSSSKISFYSEIIKRVQAGSIQSNDWDECFAYPQSKYLTSRFGNFFSQVSSSVKDNKVWLTSYYANENLTRTNSQNTQASETVEHSHLSQGSLVNETEFKNYNVNICSIISREDLRTTAMIKNIPNKFSREKILSIINMNFSGTYDWFILPTDSNANKNFGYGFINFINHLSLINFFTLFNKKRWSGTNSKKICEITYSKIQGKGKLLKHYPQKIITQCYEGAFIPSTPSKFIIPREYLTMFKCYYPEAKIIEMNAFFLVIA